MSSFNAKFMKLVLAEVEAAFNKVATPDATVVFPEFDSAEAARDSFRALFLAELTTRLTPEKPTEKKAKSPKKEAVVAEPAAVPLPSSPASATSEKKKRAPMTEEAKAAMKAKREATKAAKAGSPKAESPKAETKVETPKAPKKARKPKAESPKAETPKAETPKAESPKSDGEKKKRAPMTEEAKAAMKAKREATKAAKAAGESPAAKAEPNLKKVDPTWKKHLKTVAKANGKEVTKEMEAELLSYLNRFTAAEFGAKKAEEHVTEFLRPATASNAAAATPTDLDVVEFNGKDYFVNPETRRVYEGLGARDDDTGAYDSYKPVGYVGMAAFAEMTLE